MTRRHEIGDREQPSAEGDVESCGSPAAMDWRMVLHHATDAAQRRVTGADAEDVAQQALFEMWLAMLRGRVVRQPCALVRSIVDRRSANQRRRRLLEDRCLRRGNNRRDDSVSLLLGHEPAAPMSHSGMVQRQLLAGRTDEMVRQIDGMLGEETSFDVVWLLLDLRDWLCDCGRLSPRNGAR